MEFIKRNKKIFFFITYSILLVFALFNISSINQFIGTFLGVISPVIFGLVFAFLIGLIAKNLNRLISKVIKKQRSSFIVSIILSYIIFLAIIVGFFLLVIPQMIKSVQEIASFIPQAMNESTKFIEEISIRFNISDANWQSVRDYILQLLNQLYNFLTNSLPQIFSYAFNVVSFFSDVVFGLVISVYILISKETLAIQSKKAITVILPERFAVKTIQIFSKANKIFKSYITGQVLVSVIMGASCFVGMLIFGFNYAPLVSVIITVTNLIPIIGPILGSILGALIIMIGNPLNGLWFLIMMLVLQQIDANFITPKIIGESVGMSGLWVLIAILLGGGLFGLFGMIIGVPTMGVIYGLIKEFVYKRYDGKKFDSIVFKKKT